MAIAGGVNRQQRRAVLVRAGIFDSECEMVGQDLRELPASEQTWDPDHLGFQNWGILEHAWSCSCSWPGRPITNEKPYRARERDSHSDDFVEGVAQLPSSALVALASGALRQAELGGDFGMREALDGSPHHKRRIGSDQPADVAMQPGMTVLCRRRGIVSHDLIRVGVDDDALPIRFTPMRT